MPRLLRRLKQAVVAQLPWEAALYPIARDHYRRATRMRLEQVLDNLLAGGILWMALGAAGFLTADDPVLLETAERANNWPWALTALADSKEQSLAHRWRMLVTAVVPACTIAAGVCVGLIV